MNAAEMTQSTGNSAKASATQATTWRHPVGAEHLAHRRLVVFERRRFRFVGLRDGVHRISSRDRVARKLNAEIVATIRKITSETAAAKP